ncbi:MAG: ribonuclease Z [Flavobacteriales bacterium]|nr:ribonuclease Z [Flavobacteriales bacterium]
MHRPPFTVTTLGTGAALPARGRYPTSQLVQVNGAWYLVDCGEGTQERLRSIGFNFQRIGHIFISHLHGDHYLGLMGLISSMHLMGRLVPLTVHGPPDLKPIIDMQLRASGTYLRYPFHFQATAPVSGEVLLEDDRVTVSSLALQHRIPCTGFVFRERQGPRLLKPDRVVEIPTFKRTAVKNGEDLVFPDGRRVSNAELTLEPLRPRSYAYCSDTAYAPELLPFLRGVDLLYHESTFTAAMAARAKETMHSTASQAATIARDAVVGKLLLGHFSSRYKSVDVLLDEARAVFPNTVLASEGAEFPIPG